MRYVTKEGKKTVKIEKPFLFSTTINKQEFILIQEFYHVMILITTMLQRKS